MRRLNNVYRLTSTAHSTVGDFLGKPDLRIVNEVTYQSTLERLGDPKLSVKRIKQECQRQLGDLLPFVTSHCKEAVADSIMPYVRRGLCHLKKKGSFRTHQVCKRL